MMGWVKSPGPDARRSKVRSVVLAVVAVALQWGVVVLLLGTGPPVALKLIVLFGAALFTAGLTIGMVMLVRSDGQRQEP